MAKRWYTLTVRVGVDEPIKQARIAAQAQPPGFTLAPAIKEALCVEGMLYLDDVILIPDDIPREKKRNRVIRAPDSLWDAARVRADEKGETVSEAVRKFLIRYTRESK